MVGADLGVNFGVDLAVGGGRALVELRIDRPTDVATTGANAMHAARRLGFASLDARRIGIAAAELASNILNHGGGEGSVGLWLHDGDLIIEALDRGPGVPDPRMIFDGRAQREARGDHGGHGLGEGGASVRRLMDAVDATHREGGGLRVLARRKLPLR